MDYAKMVNKITKETNNSFYYVPKEMFMILNSYIDSIERIRKQMSQFTDTGKVTTDVRLSIYQIQMMKEYVELLLNELERHEWYFVEIAASESADEV